MWCYFMQTLRMMETEFPICCVVFTENTQLLTSASRGSVDNSMGHLTCRTRIKTGLLIYSTDILKVFCIPNCILHPGDTSVNKTANHILFYILEWGGGQ